MAPRLAVNLDKLTSNTAEIVTMCGKLGISVTGVTKSCCGHPRVAGAMLAGGIRGFGESRLANIARLRSAGFNQEIVLLRSPALSEVEPTVRLADISLNSESAVLRALNDEARNQGRRHRVILMVESGDLREGIWPKEDVGRILEEVKSLPWIQVVGLGTNHACFGGVVPTMEGLESLAELALQAENLLGERLELVSGGNSSALSLIKNGSWCKGVNHLRIGESIMLGWDITDNTPLRGLFQDVFQLYAEVIECRPKPTKPMGPVSRNAFGHIPVFEDRGVRQRAILSVGKQDFGGGSLVGTGAVKVLGATSDHLVVDVEEAVGVRVGTELMFALDYGSLVGLMTSPYVEKEWIGHGT